MRLNDALSQIADIRQGVGPAQIDHLNREKVIAVEANTSGRSLSEVTTEMNLKLKALQLPRFKGEKMTITYPFKLQ